jgi:hypothetical protein
MDTQNESVEALPATRGRPKGSKDSQKRKPKDKPVKPFGRSTNYLHHRLGHLTIVAKGPVNTSKSRAAFALWVGLCDCGNTKIVTSRAIRLGEVKTCGQSGCPFRTALLTTNLNKNLGDKMRTQIINKGAKYPFKLTADEVRALTRQPCSLCGAKGKAHELRCYDPPVGYVLSNTYSICRSCVGLVPIGPGYTSSWREVIEHLHKVVGHLSLVGHMVDKVYQEFEEAVVKAEEVRKEEEPTVIPDGILCF